MRLNIRAPRHAIRVGAESFPFLRTVERADAVAPLADYMAEAEDGPIVITVRERPVAVLVRVGGLDLEDLSVGTDPTFLDFIERSRRETGALSKRARKPRKSANARARGRA